MSQGIEGSLAALRAVRYLEKKRIERLENGSGSDLFWWIISISFGLYLGLLVLEFM